MSRENSVSSTHNTYNIRFVFVGYDIRFVFVGFFSPTPGNSATQIGCPAIQFTSDTIYLEMTSDPTGLRAQSLKTDPAKNTHFIVNHGSRLLPMLLTACKSELPTPSSSGSFNLNSS